MTALGKVLALLIVIIVTGVGACLMMIVQPFVTPIESSPPAVDPLRLEQHVKRLSVDFYPRRYDRIDNIERTVQYITDELRATGAAMSTQEIVVGGRKFRNVIARFGPASGPLL